MLADIERIQADGVLIAVVVYKIASSNEAVQRQNEASLPGG